MEKLTIDKIAKLAYVSKSVVSRVLNEHPNVSEEARKRVLEVVNKYNYRPSSLARGLATNNTFEIGVLTTRWGDENLGNGYWTLLHLGIFDECVRCGYFVRLSFISAKMEEDIYHFILNERRLDGFVLVTHEVTDLVFDTLAKRDLPTVLIGRDPGYPDVCSVDVDNRLGAYKATRHLIELGHKQIGIMLADLSLQESTHRLQGYKEALSEANIDVPDSFLSVGDYSQEKGYTTMKDWILRQQEMTAVFCASDTLAMGALLALHEENIRVPDEFSVIGFDGLPASQYMIPPLTTIQQPIYGKGERAAQLLIQQIQHPGGKISNHTSLEPELIVRKSTGEIKL